MNPSIDRSAPGVRISLLRDEKAPAGTPLNLGDRLIGFTFEDTEDKADRVLLQLDNFDLSLFDRDDLMGGSLLEVVWGYPGRASAPQRVVVKKIKGFQRLTVEGHALSMLMNQAVKTRNWSNTSRSAVARSIAEENGYAGSAIDIEDTEETLDIIHQSAETDAGFLRRLAIQDGFEFYVDSSGFHFHRRKKGRPPAHSFTRSDSI